MPRTTTISHILGRRSDAFRPATTISDMRATRWLGRAAGVLLLWLLVFAASASAAEVRFGDGGWSWFQDPRAVTYTGDQTRTYVGWVTPAGDVTVGSYDHGTGQNASSVLHAALQEDDHVSPALHVRPDGRIVAFYARHSEAPMYYRVTTQPEDVTSWGPEQTITTNIGTTFGFTYPNPMRLAAENRTYLFWRGGSLQPSFSTQEDGSEEWAPARQLITVPGERPQRQVRIQQPGHDPLRLHRGASERGAGQEHEHLLRALPGGADRARERCAHRPAGHCHHPRPDGQGLRRDRAGLDPRRRGRSRRPPGDRLRQLSLVRFAHGPPLPLRALDRDRVAGERDHPGGWLDHDKHQLAPLLGRADARARGPVTRLPVAAGGQCLEGGGLDDPRRRRDLVQPHAHAGLHREERPPALATGRRALRRDGRMDGRRVPQLPPDRDEGHGVHRGSARACLPGPGQLSSERWPDAGRWRRDGRGSAHGPRGAPVAGSHWTPGTGPAQRALSGHCKRPLPGEGFRSIALVGTVQRLADRDAAG